MTLYEHLDRHSERTRAAIESDLARYFSWCRRMEVIPIPASEDQVAAWLEDAIDEGLKVSTIRRLLSIRPV
jgi:site-specific recombinase XerD